MYHHISELPDVGRERFKRFEKRATASGCLEWLGPINRYGYGDFQIYTKSKTYRTGAHRFAYLMEHERIPDGFVIDHLCRNRACVNPEHLEAVSAVENTQRGRPIYQTHCVRGHEFTAENTAYRDKRGRWRRCRQCASIYRAERRRRLLAA